MKNKLFLLITAVTLFCFIGEIYPQITNLDTFRVIMSSNTFDYRNPVFSSPLNPPYQLNVRLMYEVRSGTSSALAWRNVDIWNYSGENFLVNNGYMNINANATNYMVIWQSNKNGNWDLYYSFWNGSNWSAPAIIDSTTASETKPNLYYSSYGYETYYLTFEKNNDIWFKYYRNGFWQGDTNLTSGITNNCTSPVYYGQRIYYLQETSPSFSLLCCQKFGISYPGYNFIWYPIETHPKPNTIRNIHASSEFHYEYDTLGGTHSYVIDNHYTFITRNMTLGFSGRNRNCSGAELKTPPVQNNPLNNYYPYTIFGFQRRTEDSNMVVAQSRFNSENVTKYFNLEDTSFVSRITGSPTVHTGYHLYKIRLIWEKKINGKIALLETFNTQIISGIKKIEETALSFSLSQNYPNPFNPSTKIKFEINKSGDIELNVFDITGKTVSKIVNEYLTAGTYEVTFDGSNLPSGIYFYQLKTNNIIETKKLILLK